MSRAEARPPGAWTPTTFFFYGTLMRAGGRDIFDGALEYVSDATVRGDLYSVSGAFPAMITGPGTVTGELWRVTHPVLLPAVLKVTDQIESYHMDREPESMYLRRVLPLLSGDADASWGYVWNRDVSFWMAPIPSGSWREHLDATRKGELWA